jgi:predicted ATPase
LLSHLKISGFRGFRDFCVDGLARVNLFVGTNNAGKTSILEAAELVAMGTAAGLLRGPRRRGESIWVDQDGAASGRRVLDLSHLFNGHALKLGAFFEISSGSDRWVRCEVGHSPQELLFGSIEESVPVLQFKSSVEERAREISLFSPDASQRPALPSSLFDSSRPVHFLGTEATLALQLSHLWDAVDLTLKEDEVVAAMQIVEPDIERIAFVGEGRSLRSIFLKLAGTERFPLSSAGDGLKRMLALALHLFSSRGGYMLVDDIDTGLHHTAMVNMWKLVIETAGRLGVQVFATTQSLDCVRALA